jgi:hypothetical protein
VYPTEYIYKVARAIFCRTFLMMVKSAQPNEGVGCTPSPFHSIYCTITSKVVVYTLLAERADTLPLFLLYPYMYSMVYPTCNYACGDCDERAEMNNMKALCNL